MQLTLDPAGGTRFAAAPTRAELERQGATFVRVPKALFQDVYALCDAQRRGELPSDSPLHEVLAQLTNEVERGAIGRRAT